MNVEKELCLFAHIPVFTVGRLNDYPYRLMVQGDLNTTNDSGARVTNRVRGTYDENGENPVYSTATKFRSPRKEGSVNTHAPQVEFEISEEDFKTIMGACANRFVKRRYTIPLPSGVKVEIDRYLECEEPREFSKIVKIDIEGGDEAQIDLYLAEMRDLGFHVGTIINPPGVESPEIKERLNELMSRTWNLVK